MRRLLLVRGVNTMYSAPVSDNHLDHIAAHAFLTLRQRFWDREATSIPFKLRPKRNTQDDPLDEFLATDVLASLPGVKCLRSPGPLITPDMVLVRWPANTQALPALSKAAHQSMMAIEVKKLERTAQGTVARASGLDYNTTPPCGTIRVYDKRDKPVEMRCFYMFACLEAFGADQVVMTAMALVDGNVLNADFEFYLSIVGERTKEINLGSYRDGANRARPMLIFSNPLGIKELDHKATLVHRSAELSDRFGSLERIHSVLRTTSPKPAVFHCYQFAADIPSGWQVTELVDPFPVPARVEQTQPRGRFRLPFDVEP
jgi:hypothetical protein